MATMADWRKAPEWAAWFARPAPETVPPGWEAQVALFEQREERDVFLGDLREEGWECASLSTGTLPAHGIIARRRLSKTESEPTQEQEEVARG